MNWEKLSILGKKPLFLPILLVLTLTPVLADILSQLKVSLFLDPDNTDLFRLPNNLLLLYWSSFFLLFGQIVFVLACPDVISHYKTYKDWRENCPDALKLFKKRLYHKGNSEINQIEMELFNKYHSEILNASCEKSIIRWLVTSMYLIGLVLFLFVIFNQVKSVFKITM